MDVNKRIGDYEILEELGRGGMGRVYRVRNVISDRVEAMKVLLPDLVSRADLESRFLREIKTLAALEHPNIATLRTAMKDGDQLVMIMEFVDGESLSQRLKRGPLPVAEALTYVDHVLDALSYAHARHVIHRDIKPANMMLSSDGLVKLTDFGIARSRNDVTLTAAGTTTGSLPYMSPEQVNAEPTDARSDLYSVGISLYEMVTGQRPFQADSDFAVMVAHLKEVPRPPMELAPALGSELNAVIMKAIEKGPADRYQSADEFRNALMSVPAFAASLTTAASAVAPLPPLPTSSQAETVISKARTANVTPVTPERVRTLIDSPMPSSAPPIPTMPQPVMRKPANAVLYMAVGGVLTIGTLAGVAYYFNSRPSASAATTSAPATAPATPAATPAPAGTTATTPATAAPMTSPAATAPTTPADPSAPATTAAAASTTPASPGGTSTPAAPATAAPATASAPAAASATPTAAPTSPAPASPAAPTANAAVATSLAPAAPGASAPRATTPPSGAAARSGESNLKPAAPARTPAPSRENAAAPSAPASPAAREPAAPVQPAGPTADFDELETEIDQLSARVVAINTSLDNLRREQSRQGLGLRGDIAARQQTMNTNMTRADEAVTQKNASRALRFKALLEADVEALERFLGR
jgi:serine/threonine protein kinase